jgi:hypothetical protein
MFFLWGWGTKQTDEYAINCDCSHCESPYLSVVGFQKFIDIFFIPTIPLGKQQLLFCPQCQTQYQMAHMPFDTTKLPPLKTPIWGFSGLMVIGVLLLSAFLMTASK